MVGGFASERWAASPRNGGRLHVGTGGGFTSVPPYLLKIVARSVADYQAFIERVLERNIGIEKYFCYIVIKSPIRHRKAPLARLMEDRK